MGFSSSRATLEVPGDYSVPGVPAANHRSEPKRDDAVVHAAKFSGVRPPAAALRFRGAAFASSSQGTKHRGRRRIRDGDARSIASTAGQSTPDCSLTVSFGLRGRSAQLAPNGLTVTVLRTLT